MEITKVQKESMPAARFIGKKYSFEDRINGYFIQQWQEWITERWFEPLSGFWEDWQFEGSDVAIGLYRLKDGEAPQYWIGRFLPPDHEVPEGYGSVLLPVGTIGTCFVTGKGLDIYNQGEACLAKLEEQGYHLVTDSEDAFWFFERYEFPRSRRPDANGCLTLDYCFYISDY